MISTDNSLKIINKYQEEYDSIIRVFENEKNLKYAGSLNRLIKESTVDTPW